jgi:hypothetical protein
MTTNENDGCNENKNFGEIHKKRPPVKGGL